MREQDTVTGSGAKLSRVPTCSLFRFFWHKQGEELPCHTENSVPSGTFQQRLCQRHRTTAIERRGATFRHWPVRWHRVGFKPPS